jgi:hypothetical protein
MNMTASLIVERWKSKRKKKGFTPLDEKKERKGRLQNQRKVKSR